MSEIVEGSSGPLCLKSIARVRLPDHVPLQATKDSAVGHQPMSVPIGKRKVTQETNWAKGARMDRWRAPGGRAGGGRAVSH